MHTLPVGNFQVARDGKIGNPVVSEIPRERAESVARGVRQLDDELGERVTWRA